MPPIATIELGGPRPLRPSSWPIRCGLSSACRVPYTPFSRRLNIVNRTLMRSGRVARRGGLQATSCCGGVSLVSLCSKAGMITIGVLIGAIIAAGYAGWSLAVWYGNQNVSFSQLMNASPSLSPALPNAAYPPPLLHRARLVTYVSGFAVVAAEAVFVELCSLSGYMLLKSDAPPKPQAGGPSSGPANGSEATDKDPIDMCTAHIMFEFIYFLSLSFLPSEVISSLMLSGILAATLAPILYMCYKVATS